MPARPAQRTARTPRARSSAGPRGTAMSLATLLVLPVAVVGVQAAAVGTASAALDTTLYAVATNVLYKVDEASGATTAMPGTLPFNTNAAARQPGSGLVYFAEAAASARIGTYDVDTGAVQTLSGRVPASFTRLAFRSDGRLFGMSGSTLYEVDTATGAVLSTTTVGGTLPTSGGGDMAFDPDGDAYVIVASTLYRLPAPYTTATTIGDTGTGIAHPNLAFGSNGRLWTADSASSTSSNIAYLSTTTGAETRVSTTSGFSFTDMASAPNRKPVVSGTASASTAYRTPVAVDVSGFVTDPDGDPVTVVAVDGGGRGTGSVDSDGRAVFTPADGVSGPLTVTYTVSDGVGGFTTGTIDVVVGNAPPAFTGAAGNTAQTIARGDVPAPVVASDPNTEPLTYEVTGGQLPPGVSLRGDGTFTGAATVAGTYTVTIRAVDASGDGDSTTLTITVEPDPPVYTDAATNRTQTVQRRQTPAPVEAVDPDGGPVTYALTGGALPDGVELRSDGGFSGSPTARGTSTATITATDAEGATAVTELVITVPNAAPEFGDAAGNTAQTLVQGEAPTALTADDLDGDQLGFTVTGGALPPGVTLRPDGTFTGAATASGTFSVTVTVDDDHGGTTQRELRLVVNAADAPRPGDDSATTTAGEPVTTEVLANDTDPAGHALRVTDVSDAGHGTVTLLSGGVVRYQPDAGWSGPDSYTYTVDNGRGGTATGTVAVRTTPVAVDDVATATGREAVGIAVLENDQGTLDPGSVAVSSAPEHGTVTPGESGTLRYLPALGFTGTDTFSYTAVDASGTSVTAEVTVTVEAPAGPRAADLTSTGTGPAPQTRTAEVPEGGSATLLEGDKPVDTITVDGEGTWVIDPATGEITFTPELGFAGGATVRYRVTDAYGKPAEADYTATVTAPAAPAPGDLTTTGTAPAAQSVEVTVPEGGTASLLDGDQPVPSLVVPGEGRYELEPVTGELVFRPEPGFTGEATPARYRVTDAYGQAGEATYTPTVTKPDAPQADPQTTTGPGAQSTTVAVPVGGSVTLLDADQQEVRTLTVPDQGTYTLDPATGTITFTPVEGFTGQATPVSYRVTDAYGQAAVSTYAATVTDEPTPEVPEVPEVPEEPEVPDEPTVDEPVLEPDPVEVLVPFDPTPVGTPPVVRTPAKPVVRVVRVVQPVERTVVRTEVRTVVRARQDDDVPTSVPAGTGGLLGAGSPVDSATAMLGLVISAVAGLGLRRRRRPGPVG